MEYFWLGERRVTQKVYVVGQDPKHLARKTCVLALIASQIKKGYLRIGMQARSVHFIASDKVHQYAL